MQPCVLHFRRIGAAHIGLSVANEAEANNLLEVLRRRGFCQDEPDAMGCKHFYCVFEQVWKQSRLCEKIKICKG